MERGGDDTNDEKTHEQQGFQAEGPAMSGAPACDRNDRGGDAPKQEKWNAENLDEKAGIVGHELCTGNDETSGDLRDEQSKQTENCAAVDIAGNGTEHACKDLETSKVGRGRGRRH